MDVQPSREPAMHLLHGWWIASCLECGYELARRRGQAAAERAGLRRRCPICQPTADPTPVQTVA